MNTLKTRNEILLALVREGLGLERMSISQLTELSYYENTFWKSLFRLSMHHGVGAIAYDGLVKWMQEPIFKDRFPKDMLLQWGASTIQIEKTYEHQFLVSKDLAEKYEEAHISTIVLKGLVVSHYYPIPNHRPCCDLDCFLLGKYAEGNKVALKAGAIVDEDDYKHSHIRYKGLMVENHQFLTAFNGTKYGTKVEKLLQLLLLENPEYTYIDNSCLRAPNKEFTLLFLLKHAQNHFVTEGVSIRHLCDWALFLQCEYERLDWDKINSCLDVMNLRCFAALITRWCTKHLNLFLSDHDYFGQCPDDLLHSFEDDMFTPLLLTNNMKWWQKIPVIINRYKRIWHFRQILTESIFLRMWNTMAYCSYFHRTPKLN